MKSIGLAAMLGFAVVSAPANAESWEKRPIKVRHSERQIEPGVWTVRASTNSFGGAQIVVAYRAAEIVSESGFAFVQIIDQKGKVTWAGSASRTSGLHDPHDVMEMTVRGSHSAVRPAECRARQPEHCMTVPAAALMARYGSRLPPDYLANR